MADTNTSPRLTYFNLFAPRGITTAFGLVMSLPMATTTFIPPILFSVVLALLILEGIAASHTTTTAAAEEARIPSATSRSRRRLWALANAALYLATLAVQVACVLAPVRGDDFPAFFRGPAAFAVLFTAIAGFMLPPARRPTTPPAAPGSGPGFDIYRPVRAPDWRGGDEETGTLLDEEGALLGAVQGQEEGVIDHEAGKGGASGEEMAFGAEPWKD